MPTCSQPLLLAPTNCDAVACLLKAQLISDVCAAVSRHGIGPDSRLIDVGSGTGRLIQQLQREGHVQDILATDLSAKMLEALHAQLGHPSTVGNDKGEPIPSLVGLAL